MNQAVTFKIGKLELTWKELRRAIFATLVLLTALASSVASSFFARAGNLPATVVFTALSLILAAFIAFTVVPGLFTRVRKEWGPLPFRITREGWYYLLALSIVGLAAFNTNNNLLFIVFSATLTTFLVSGVLSRQNLRKLRVNLEIPETVEARRPYPALVKWQSLRLFWPSFSLHLEPEWPATGKKQNPHPCAEVGAYLPYLPPGSHRECWISLEFPRRGLYRTNGLTLSSVFPFGFVRRTRCLGQSRQVIALPELDDPEEFFETLPMVTGSTESLFRGDGSDLYSIRDYLASDNARFLDWKATAKTSQLKLREFTREDERKCCFVLDNFFPDFDEPRHRPLFEKAVSLCANALRHFHDMESEVSLITPLQAIGFSASREGLVEMLKALALLEPSPEGIHFLTTLSGESAFKIIFTARPRGVLPTSVWNSAHVVFIRELGQK